MTKKATIPIGKRVNAVFRRGQQLLEAVTRPFFMPDRLSTAYAEMANDRTRDANAEEWCQSLAADASNAL